MAGKSTSSKDGKKSTLSGKKINKILKDSTLTERDVYLGLENINTFLKFQQGNTYNYVPNELQFYQQNRTNAKMSKIRLIDSF